MGIKGTLFPDHIPTNKYSLFIVGSAVNPLFFTKISGFEQEMDTVELPDRTMATGGNLKAFEFTAECPLHHEIQNAFMEIWFSEASDPVSLVYKKAGVLTMTSGSGENDVMFSLIGVYISKRKLPDLSFESEGDMAVVEWTFQCDNLLVIQP